MSLNLPKMYAIVEIAGQQFKVEKKGEIFVHRLEGEPGTKVEFKEVLLIDHDGKVSVGMPIVEGSKITGKIIEHVRGDKVIVFKKKKRKGFQKETGHRQDFSKVLIENITVKGAAKEKKAKKEEEAE
jgi:large subunit ribosomal protein L21